MGRRPHGYTLYLDRSGQRTAKPLTEEIGAADTWPELRAMTIAAECFENGERLWARDEGRGHRLTIEQLREDADPNDVAGELTAYERDTLRAADQILQRRGHDRILPQIERDARNADNPAAMTPIEKRAREIADRARRGELPLEAGEMAATVAFRLMKDREAVQGEGRLYTGEALPEWCTRCRRDETPQPCTLCGHERLLHGSRICASCRLW